MLLIVMFGVGWVRKRGGSGVLGVGNGFSSWIVYYLSEFI